MVIAPFFSFEMILGDVEPRVAYVANKVRVFGLGIPNQFNPSEAVLSREITIRHTI